MQYNFSYIRISGLIFLHFERFEDLVSENVELSYICAYMCLPIEYSIITYETICFFISFRLMFKNLL